MGKVSKNARTDRGGNEQSKSFVKVVKAFKSKKTGSYAFKEGLVHKDDVKAFFAENKTAESE